MSAIFQLAPMAELTHRALRQLVYDFGGCDEYFSEMISAPALLANGPFEKWYIDNGPCPKKLVFQLVGSDAEQISRAAAILDNLECLGIDINMCCNAPLIRKSGAGVTLMGSIEHAGALISKVRPNVRRRLSVKLSMGFKEDFEYLACFCRRLEAEGVDLITLYPRTAMEKFKRPARWDYVSKLKQQLKIPLAGNGDIQSAGQLLSRSSLCDAVMSGRGAIKQPWIFAEARKLEVNEAINFVPNIEETGLRFLELLARYQPPEFHLSRARRFFGFFCDNLKWGNYLKNLLNQKHSLSAIEQVWRTYFTDNME